MNKLNFQNGTGYELFKETYVIYNMPYIETYTQGISNTCKSV